MSRQLSTNSRRGLHTRPSGTVERLLAATGDELEHIYAEELSIRSVTQQARISPATADSYQESERRLQNAIALIMEESE